MPITTKSGFRTGTVSVMDERSREGLTQVEVDLLGDRALTTMAHLELATPESPDEGRRRSEKMVNGLGRFNEDRSDLDNWWLDT